MSMKTCSTIKVRSSSQSGYTIINESDFDPEKHERWKDSDAKEASKQKAGPPAPNVKDGFVLAEHVRQDTAEALDAAGLGGPLAIDQATVDELVAVKGVGLRVAEQLKSAVAPFIERPEPQS